MCPSPLSLTTLIILTVRHLPELNTEVYQSTFSWLYQSIEGYSNLDFSFLPYHQGEQPFAALARLSIDSQQAVQQETLQAPHQTLAS